MKVITPDIRSAAIISSFIVLPFAILELLSNAVNRHNAPGLTVLFGLLWLLPSAFIVIVMPMVRHARAGGSVVPSPANVLRFACLTLIAVTWGGLLADQVPCFVGVPNCD